MTTLAPIVQVAVEPSHHLIRVRLSGVMTLETMKAFREQYTEATHEFSGKSHVVLADMRGLRTLPAELAEMFQATISFARSRGVVLCAHVTDQPVTRLQAGRLARQATVADDVTVDCDSVEEAMSACREAELRIRRDAKSKFPLAESVP